MTRFPNLPYHYGLKVRIYPSRSQVITIKKNSSANRFWYNYFLGLDRYKYEIKERYNLRSNPLIMRWYKDVHNKRRTSYAKHMFPFLRNTRLDYVTRDNAYLNYTQAWANYDSGLQDIPKFHSKRKQGNYWTYQTACTYHKIKSGRHIGSVKILDKKHVQLPKLGRIRTSRIRNRIYHKSQLRFGRVTISKDKTNQFYASFQLGSTTPFIRLSKVSSQIAMLGYDLNTSNFLMDTDHDDVPNPRFYEKSERKLKWLQHCLSRKYRHNQGRELSKCKDYQENSHCIARLSKHVRLQRCNFLQQLSTKLIESHDFLVGEDLRSSNMLRNHRLAKAIQSVGWRSFISMLEYKAKLYHKIFVLINPAYTTQKCSKCGYVCNQKDGTHLTLNNRTWTCPSCGAHHVRDLNASVNILNSGIKAIENYLPKKLKSSVRMVTDEHKLDQRSLQWLQYLVTRYYGVIDSTGRRTAKLVRED